MGRLLTENKAHRRSSTSPWRLDDLPGRRVRECDSDSRTSRPAPAAPTTMVSRCAGGLFGTAGCFAGNEQVGRQQFGVPLGSCETMRCGSGAWPPAHGNQAGASKEMPRSVARMSGMPKASARCSGLGGSR